MTVKELPVVRSPLPDYRYYLSRCLRTRPGSGTPRSVLFCMLNPSTANEVDDDATIRCVIRFAGREGFDHLSVVNLYAARSTDPRNLGSFDDPVGPDNDTHIRIEAVRAHLVVAAWGVPQRRRWRARADDVLAILAAERDVYRLGDPTKDGHPRHPGRLPAGTPLQLHAQRRNTPE